MESSSSKKGVHQSMENLNPEIILEIFSWLPVDDLVLRCARVCKTWRSLLRVNKFYFADIHYRHQLQLQYQLDHDDDDQKYKHSDTTNIRISGAAKLGVGLLFRIFQNDGCKEVLHYTEDYDYDNDQQEMCQDQYWNKKLVTSSRIDDQMPAVWAQESYHIDMVGSCNGLICFSIDSYGLSDDPIYICNPITGEYIDLPLIPMEDCDHVVIGFGYHPSTNKYKVVKIVYHLPCKKGRPTVGHVHVYTLGDGNGWRHKGEITYRLYGGITTNGALYWQADKDWKIVTFDLADEEFHLLPRPPRIRSHDYFYLGIRYEIQEIGRCLCFVHQDLRRQCMAIWSLNKRKNKNDSSGTKEKEYKKSWSWTREFSISWKGMDKNEFNDDRMFQPVVLTKSGKLLLISRYERILFLYDQDTGTMRKLMSGGTGLRFSYATPHMNSFISLKALGENSERIVKKQEISADQQ